MTWYEYYGTTARLVITRSPLFLQELVESSWECFSPEDQDFFCQLLQKNWNAFTMKVSCMGIVAKIIDKDESKWEEFYKTFKDFHIPLRSLGESRPQKILEHREELLQLLKQKQQWQGASGALPWLQLSSEEAEELLETYME